MAVGGRLETLPADLRVPARPLDHNGPQGVQFGQVDHPGEVLPGGLSLLQPVKYEQETASQQDNQNRRERLPDQSGPFEVKTERVEQPARERDQRP